VTPSGQGKKEMTRQDIEFEGYNFTREEDGSFLITTPEDRSFILEAKDSNAWAYHALRALFSENVYVVYPTVHLGDKTIRELQSSLPWTAHYHRDFRSSPMTHKDFGHGLLHVHKAGGKLASIINDAEHGGVHWEDPAVRSEIAKYLADFVICALRMANTCPDGVIDLQRAVEDRLIAKNNQLAMAKEEMAAPETERFVVDEASPDDRGDARPKPIDFPAEMLAAQGPVDYDIWEGAVRTESGGYASITRSDKTPYGALLVNGKSMCDDLTNEERAIWHKISDANAAGDKKRRESLKVLTGQPDFRPATGVGDSDLFHNEIHFNGTPNKYLPEEEGGMPFGGQSL
jgi:hypothetical protein